MKKLFGLKSFFALVVIGTAVLFSSVAYARKAPVEKVLYDTSNVAMTSYTFSAAKTTLPVLIKDNVGFMTLVIDMTSGTIDSITYEVSMDGRTWFTPSTTDGTSLTSVGSIVTDNITTDQWIIPTARLANFIRFTITPSGSTVMSASLVYQAELL